MYRGVVSVIYKNVAALSDAISFLFFFVSGVLSPLQIGTGLYVLSRLLPLSSGIDVIRAMVLENVSITASLVRWDLGLLAINTTFYLFVGVMILNWCSTLHPTRELQIGSWRINCLLARGP